MSVHWRDCNGPAAGPILRRLSAAAQSWPRSRALPWRRRRRGMRAAGAVAKFSRDKERFAGPSLRLVICAQARKSARRSPGYALCRVGPRCWPHALLVAQPGWWLLEQIRLTACCSAPSCARPQKLRACRLRRAHHIACSRGERTTGSQRRALYSLGSDVSPPGVLDAHAQQRASGLVQRGVFARE
jgi:hypothetical protein